MRSRSIVAAAAFLLFPNVAQTAEIKFLASGAVKDAYLELLPSFEKASGHTGEKPHGRIRRIFRNGSREARSPISLFWATTARSAVRDGKSARAPVRRSQNQEFMLRCARARRSRHRFGRRAETIGSCGEVRCVFGGASGTYIVRCSKNWVSTTKSGRRLRPKPNEPVAER